MAWMCFTWLRLHVKVKYMKQKSPPAQKYHFTWQRWENLRVVWMLGKELSTESGLGGATYIISWMWPSSGSRASDFQIKKIMLLSIFCLSIALLSSLQPWSYTEIHRWKIQWDSDRHMHPFVQGWWYNQILKW